jgi:hypothetical protein
MRIADAAVNSGGICATSLPHGVKFNYKDVAFFFAVSLELTHQASQSRFGNRMRITSRTVRGDLGVQK